MSKLNDFLSEAGVFFLATCDGAQPKLRPLGAHAEIDGKVMFGVGTFKNVYKQLLANPLVEIAACRDDGHWLRYTGRAVFDEDPAHIAEMITVNQLEPLYNDKTGNKLAVFYLEDATAMDITLTGEGTDLL